MNVTIFIDVNNVLAMCVRGILAIIIPVRVYDDRVVVDPVTASKSVFIATVPAEVVGCCELSFAVVHIPVLCGDDGGASSQPHQGYQPQQHAMSCRVDVECGV